MLDIIQMIVVYGGCYLIGAWAAQNLCPLLFRLGFGPITSFLAPVFAILPLSFCWSVRATEVFQWLTR